MPKGYIVGHVTIHDPKNYAAYSARNDTLLAQYGGRFCARGGEAETVEGTSHARHVILEFPSIEQARAFYNSPEYQDNLKIRQANAESVIMIVEGI